MFQFLWRYLQLKRSFFKTDNLTKYTFTILSGSLWKDCTIWELCSYPDSADSENCVIMCSLLLKLFIIYYMFIWESVEWIWCGNSFPDYHLLLLQLAIVITYYILYWTFSFTDKSIMNNLLLVFLLNKKVLLVFLLNQMHFRLSFSYSTYHTHMCNRTIIRNVG